MRIYVQATRHTHPGFLEPIPAEWSAWTDDNYRADHHHSEAAAVGALFLLLYPDTEVVQLETRVVPLTDADWRAAFSED